MAKPDGTRLDGATCERCDAITGPYQQSLVEYLVDALARAGVATAPALPGGQWCLSCVLLALEDEFEVLLAMGQVPGDVALALRGI